MQVGDVTVPTSGCPDTPGKVHQEQIPGGPLCETNSSPLKIAETQQESSSSNHPFSGAMSVLGRVRTFFSAAVE